MLAFIVSIALAWLLPDEKWQPIVFVSSVALATLVWIPLVIFLIRTDRSEQRKATTDTRKDLEEGIANVQHYQAKGAMRAILEEHRERCFFIRLDDDRVIFVGPWDPPDDDNPADINTDSPETERFPSTEFEIVRAPASNIVLSTRGLGQPLQPSQTFVMKQGTKYDPNYGAFVKVPWEKIATVFGTKK